MRFRGKTRSRDIKLAGKWLFRFVLIGVVADFGAVMFHYLCGLGMHYFLDMMAGYRPDLPPGEHLFLPYTQTPFNRWVLLILPALGGVVSGWIIYTFTPEAEDHGTMRL